MPLIYAIQEIFNPIHIEVSCFSNMYHNSTIYTMSVSSNIPFTSVIFLNFNICILHFYSLYNEPTIGQLIKNLLNCSLLHCP